MRAVVLLVIIFALGLLFWRQKQNGPSQATTPPSLTPAPRGQASEHNYMKRALDRGGDVTEQGRARTEQAQKP